MRAPRAATNRNIQIQSRWTRDEVQWIDSVCNYTGENRSEYLRRLVAADRKQRSKS